MMKEPLAFTIMAAVERFRSLPTDFLAQKVGRRTLEIEPYLTELEKEGAIKREGDVVSLSAVDAAPKI